MKKQATHLKVTQVRSLIGETEKHRLVVKGLGLRRIGHSIELVDTPATRGMVERVQHLITVEVHKGAANTLSARARQRMLKK